MKAEEFGYTPKQIEEVHPCRFCADFIPAEKMKGCDGYIFYHDPRCARDKPEFCDWKTCDDYQEIEGV